jgi:putative transposase
MTAICTVLGIARRTAYYIDRARPRGRYHRADDATVLQQIRAVTNSRATYGYRRVWAMVNRTFRVGYNRKRIRRVMQLHGLMLAPRCIAATGSRTSARSSNRPPISAGARTSS